MSKGASDAPLWRLTISPAATAASAQGGNNLPTPASLVADLEATANFKSAIADLNDDGSGGALPYLGYLKFPCADEVHEDEEKQNIFPTLEDVAELEEVDSGTEAGGTTNDEDRVHNRAYHEQALRSRAQHAALKQYVLNQRVFFALMHTDRCHH